MTDQQEQAEEGLIEWAEIHRDRDNRIRAARAAGVSKNRIHTLTGLSRVTIDNVLDSKYT